MFALLCVFGAHRVVFAQLAMEHPHILLLDEPTNHLDMASIDALARAIKEYEGGVVIVSHDFREFFSCSKFHLLGGKRRACVPGLSGACACACACTHARMRDTVWAACTAVQATPAGLLPDVDPRLTGMGAAR